MSKNFFQELSSAQMKIGFIFQELMNERDAYEYKSEKLEDKINVLNKEIKLLKERNKILLEANESLTKFMSKLFSSFLNLNQFVKNFKSDGSTSGNIQELYLNLWKKIEGFLKHSNFSGLQLTYESETKSNNCDENFILNSRFQQAEDAIKKEIESLKNLNFSLQFSRDEKLEEKLSALKKIKLYEKSEVADCTMKRKESEDVKPLFCKRENNFTGNEVFSLSKNNVISDRSPVFKDLRNKKLENSEGMRKLTQTLLNMDSFKQKYSENSKKECGKKVEKEKSSNTVDTKDDEDDVIIDSPEKNQNFKGLSKGKKKCSYGSKTDFYTPSSTLGIDLDETYVSSTLVRNCKLTEKEVLEKIIEDQTPLKEFIREKSPKTDLVSFVCKREAVRKKAQRLDLPGHTCMECNKYYKEAWGDEFNSDNKKRELLNKCSRHRNKFSPTDEDTPAVEPRITSIIRSGVFSETLVKRNDPNHIN